MQYHFLPHEDKGKGTAIDYRIVLESPPPVSDNISELLQPEDDIMVSAINYLVPSPFFCLISFFIFMTVQR